MAYIGGLRGSGWPKNHKEKRRLKRCGRKGGLGEGRRGGKVGEKARLREVKAKYLTKEG